MLQFIAITTGHIIKYIFLIITQTQYELVCAVLISLWQLSNTALEKYTPAPSTEDLSNYGVTINPQSRYRSSCTNWSIQNFPTLTMPPWAAAWLRYDHLAWLEEDPTFALEEHDTRSVTTQNYNIY